MKKILILVGALMIGAVVYFSFATPSLSSRHGGLDTHLYLNNNPVQPLVVAFGGGSGGNDWERRYLSDKRDSLLAHGFAVLAIGYFKTENTPNALDRISLDAIADTILQIARRTPQIDTGRIVLLGGSKGGELVLNLASRYACFKGVVALSTSHVSFPALTISANTSSWLFQNQEVPYVPAPFKTIVPAIKGDLYTAFSMMLEDTQAVAAAEIPVERIQGPILLISADQDEQWPAKAMSEKIVDRLRSKGFQYPYEHLVVSGNHVEPLNHFDKVLAFLNQLK